MLLLLQLMLLLMLLLMPLLLVLLLLSLQLLAQLLLPSWRLQSPWGLPLQVGNCQMMKF